MDEGNIVTLFNSSKDRLNSEIEMRQKIKMMCKEHDQLTREITIILQAVHYSNNAIGPVCLTARAKFEKAREIYAKMQKDVPYPHYYKFYEYWRLTTQKYCFLVAFTIWLETETMPGYETVAEVLDFSTDTGTNLLYLDTEDYLYGLLMLCSELARLASSSVMKKNYSRPLQISKSVLEISSGIGLLDIKSDQLRKRIEAVKYDVKKIEEIIYDLSLRGLLINAKTNAKEAQEKGVAKSQEKGEAEKSLKNEEADQKNEKAEADLKNGVAKGQDNRKADEDLKNAMAAGQENGTADKDLNNGVAAGQENGKAEEDLKKGVAEGQEKVEAEAGGDADRKPKLVVD